MRNASTALALVVTIACGNLTPTPAPAPVLGRWLFTFHIMGGLFRTPVELVADSVGLLKANALGPPLVRFNAASASGDQLQLQGTSRYGAVHVKGRLVGDSFDGRWRIKILRGAVTAKRLAVAPSSVGQRVAIFHALRDSLARRYYDSTFGGLSWDSLTTAYRPQAAAARSDGEWLAAVRRMLGELHSSHLDLSAISVADAFPTRGGGANTDESKIIEWRSVDSRVGYLRIAQFDEGPAAIARLDSAFAALRGHAGLVVDLRGNPGGTLGIAMRLGDYLMSRPTPVGTFTTRRASAAPAQYSGYSVDEFLRLLREKGAVTLVAGGHVAQPYQGRVAILIDGGSGSTTEAFVAVLQELHLASLVGQRTAGAMLSSAELQLDGGWVLRFPEADFRTPAGQRIEGRGVSPDIVASRHWYRDSQLRAAVSIVTSDPRERREAR